MLSVSILTDKNCTFKRDVPGEFHQVLLYFCTLYITYCIVSIHGPEVTGHAIHLSHTDIYLHSFLLAS